MLAKYRIYLVRVQVRWDKAGTEPENYYVFLRTGYSEHKEVISAIKKLEFFSHRMSYKGIRGSWCDAILNVHTLTENKRDSFYEKLGQTFDPLPNTHNNSIRILKAKL
jgi:hypothetical protein